MNQLKKINKEEKQTFLKDILTNVKKQILIDEINIRYFEREKLLGNADKLVQLQTLIDNLKKEKQELERKIDVIIDELDE